MPFDDFRSNLMAGRNEYGYMPSVGMDEHV